MKTSLRKGNAQTLNIYILALQQYLGYAAFPWNYNQSPWQDGVMLHYSALPGGSAVGTNTGLILVHEVGHWVGLLHTFQDGCNGGDYVDDTAPEASPASGCPIGRDTCPGGGPDREQTSVPMPKIPVTHRVSSPAIDNHMDYSNDACRKRFTNGQVNRLAGVIYQYRGINLY